MQAKNTSNGRTFFNDLNLFKSLLLVGILALSFNVSAKIYRVGDRIETGGLPGFYGLEYIIVEAGNTGRLWLDRNLGAIRACMSAKDADCYGDLYQWGRSKDGHELRTSGTVGFLAKSIKPATSEFILRSLDGDWVNETARDEKGFKRGTAWKYGGVNDICPDDFGVPTREELEELVDDLGIINGKTAFNSVLKIPFSGYRYNQTGAILRAGEVGYLWSRTTNGLAGISDRRANAFYVDNGIVWSNYRYRAHAFSVRCILEL